jgi:hypothetical protein
MHRLIKPIFWTFLFLVMMLVIDQVLVQVPPIHPAHAAVSNFYQDFRSRLTDLGFGEKKAAPKSIEAVISKQQKKTAPKKTEQTKEQKTEIPRTPQAQKSQRYIYSDGKGELHFADSLDDVPDEFRGLAQPMGD